MLCSKGQFSKKVFPEKIEIYGTNKLRSGEACTVFAAKRRMVYGGGKRKNSSTHSNDRDFLANFFK